MSDMDWLLDSVMGFLKSPEWAMPVMQFIDDNCIVFDSEEENKMAYMEIYSAFKEMVDSLLEYHLSEMGVTAEQFVMVCEKSMGDQTNQKVLEQLLAVDDFLSFKKMMLKRNLELDLETMKMVQKAQEVEKEAEPEPLEGQSEEDAQFQKELAEALALSLKETSITKEDVAENIESAEKSKEEMEMEMVMAMSISLEEDRKKQQLQEEEMLQQALAVSQTEQQSSAPPVNDGAGSSSSGGGGTPPAEVQDTSAALAAAEAKMQEEMKARQSAEAALAKAQAEAAEARAKAQEEEQKRKEVEATAAQVRKAEQEKLRRQAEEAASARRVAVLEATQQANDNTMGTSKKLPSLSGAEVPVKAEAAIRRAEEARARERLQFSLQEEATAKDNLSKPIDPREAQITQRAAYLKAQRDKIVEMKRRERETEFKKEAEKKTMVPKPANTSVGNAMTGMNKTNMMSGLESQVKVDPEVQQKEQLRSKVEDEKRRQLKALLAQDFKMS